MVGRRVGLGVVRALEGVIEGVRLVGLAVERIVGEVVGVIVERKDGEVDGDLVGKVVGDAFEGASDGLNVERKVGFVVGTVEAKVLGNVEGLSDRVVVGERVGLVVGVALEGLREGVNVEQDVGFQVGEVVTVIEGDVLERMEGETVGVRLGLVVRDAEGWRDEITVGNLVGDDVDFTVGRFLEGGIVGGSLGDTPLIAVGTTEGRFVVEVGVAEDEQDGMAVGLKEERNVGFSVFVAVLGLDVERDEGKALSGRVGLEVTNELGEVDLITDG